VELYEYQKQSQSSVDYTDDARISGARNPNDECSNCRHFIRPDRCEHVKSPISPEGWCEKYESEK
jgi:hypothetical protein